MRVAVVLMNLGGPNNLEAVQPFLKNLFSDPAIIRAPIFIRYFLARYLAGLRKAPAMENYKLLGGKSPLLELTRQQAKNLELELNKVSEHKVKCFVAMRYWHPFSKEIVKEVKEFAPQKVVLLPLYPQFSSTTSASSLRDWREAAAGAGFACDVTSICCWFDDPAYIAASAKLIKSALENARAQQSAPVRILFSAHGLPESIVKKGDPYAYQIECTARAIISALGEENLDFSICFQSRATPQKWLEPSTEMTLEKAAKDKTTVLVVPIAFVSDHSETLVELDVEYRDIALKLGVPGYFRVSAQNSDPDFIEALAGITRRAIAQPFGICNLQDHRQCPSIYKNCPFTNKVAA